VKTLKIFYGTHCGIRGLNSKHRQSIIIVAATTKARAAELIGTSYAYFAKWFCETGNEAHAAVATKEGIWVVSFEDEYKNSPENFVEVENIKGILHVKQP